MPVRNNGPGGYSRASTTRKSKIEPEYPQWAESKMRAIENRRLKELQAVVRDSMPEILAIAADEMDTASESIRKDGYSDMVRRIQNRFRIMRDRLSRRLRTDPLERDVTYHIILIVEQCCRQTLGQLRLTFKFKISNTTCNTS